MPVPMVFQVTAFSRWERELPKMLTDPRFTAIPSMKERRGLFDSFCRTAAERHKRPKADRTRAARDGFMALLDEASALASTQNGVCCMKQTFNRADLPLGYIQGACPSFFGADFPRSAGKCSLIAIISNLPLWPVRCVKDLNEIYWACTQQHAHRRRHC